MAEDDPVYEDNTMTVPVLVYGIIANVVVWLPWMFYIAQEDAHKYCQFHLNYIQMLTVAYAPLSISFWLVLGFDSQQARDKMIYSLSTAKLGPFGLLWVGLYTFAMTASDGKVLDEGINTFAFFFYLTVNCFSIWLHIAWGPKVYVWAKKAPLPKDAPEEDPAAAESPSALPGPDFSEGETEKPEADNTEF